MIEAVALGQTRFQLPGLSADERGVAVGRRLLCVFGDLPHAMAFLRSLSRAGSLRDLLQSLVVEELVGETGVPETALGFETPGSFAADPCAALARAHDGVVFTGSSQHYVPYRDASRPLGCDLAEGVTLAAGERSYALYHPGGVDERAVGRTLDVKDLLMRMALQVLRPRELREERADAYVLRVAAGLLPAVRAYLWRRRVDADVALCRPRSATAFSSSAQEVAFITCRGLPEGSLTMFAATPGVHVLIPVLGHVMVERGFRHPVALESCAGLFPPEDVLVFLGQERRVESFGGPLTWVALDAAVTVEVKEQGGAPLRTPELVSVQDVGTLGVEVRLVADSGARGGAEAVIIPRTELGELVALVHLLPQALWFGCEVVLADPYSVVLAPPGVRGLPLGHALWAVHPRVYIPVGMRFSPRLREELFTAHFSLSGNDHVVLFPPPGAGAPFAVSRASFQPLSRAAVHPEDMTAALDVVDLIPGLEPAGEPVVWHPERKALRTWELERAVAPEPVKEVSRPPRRG